MLVFDFDGTVLDTERPAYQAAAELWAAHGIELGVVGGIHRGRDAPDVKDPGAQHRIGEQANTAELHQHGRVPEPAHNGTLGPGFAAWTSRCPHQLVARITSRRAKPP